MALFESYNTGNDSQGGIKSPVWLAQTFTPASTHTITSVKVMITRQTAVGTLVLSIRATDGTHPIGGDLANGSIALAVADDTWYDVTISTLTVQAGIKYAIVCRSLDANPTYWDTDGSAPSYSGGGCEGSSNAGVTWETVSGVDCMFEVYGASSSSPIAITRVSNLIHRYSRRKTTDYPNGYYLLEISMGEVVSDWGMPTPERFVPGQTVLSPTKNVLPIPAINGLNAPVNRFTRTFEEIDASIKSKVGK